MRYGRRQKMAYSRKSYAQTNFITKKYVNATEGQAIYGISRSHFMEMAHKHGILFMLGM